MIETGRVANKIFGLDLMRVGAILLVLSAHILWIYPDCKNLLTKAMSFSGFIGVEIFFVLSGFLIGGSLHRAFLKENYNLAMMRNFLRRRLFRIMPNYLLILIVNLIVFSAIGYNIAEPWKYFVFLQNFASPMLPFFPESWSMAIKEIPYFIIPFVLLFLAGFAPSGRRNRLFLFMVFGLIAIPMAAKIWFYFHHSVTLAQWNVSLRSVAIYRIDAVMTGVLFTWIRYNYINFWRRYKVPMLIFGLSVLAILAALVGFIKIGIENHPFFWDVIFLPAISIASASFLPFFSEWKSAHSILEKPVKFLGAVSYFVYLTHYSLILYTMKYLIDTTSLPLITRHIFTFAYLVLTFALSWLLYTYFEKPILRLRERKTKAYGAIEQPKPDIRA
ncbi:MAG: acyltransferase [Flavobacterium sp.]|nr:MAG: acyltransferase [Flavobacterium sp.]